MSGEPSRWLNSKLPRQALRFGLVGVLGAGLDFGILWVAVKLGGSPYGARIGSLAAAVVLTWWLNRSLTFASAQRPSWAEFWRYAAITTAGVSIQLTVYWTALYFGAPLAAAFVGGIASSMLFSFLGLRKLFAAN